MIFRWLLCRWLSPWPFYFFHRFVVIDTYDTMTRKLKCRRCDKYFASSDRHQAILPWNEEYERITCALYGIPRSKV